MSHGKRRERMRWHEAEAVGAVPGGSAAGGAVPAGAGGDHGPGRLGDLPLSVRHGSGDQGRRGVAGSDGDRAPEDPGRRDRGDRDRRRKAVAQQRGERRLPGAVCAAGRQAGPRVARRREEHGVRADAGGVPGLLPRALPSAARRRDPLGPRRRQRRGPGDGRALQLRPAQPAGASGGLREGLHAQRGAPAAGAGGLRLLPDGHGGHRGGHAGHRPHHGGQRGDRARLRLELLRPVQADGTLSRHERHGAGPGHLRDLHGGLPGRPGGGLGHACR